MDTGKIDVVSLLPPLVDREEFLRTCAETWAQPSKRNQQYYNLILTLLWPAGTPLPGNWVKLEDVRAAIDKGRKKSYKDVPRRFREMMGEEQLEGLEKKGRGEHCYYRLVSTEIGTKREPRRALGTTYAELAELDGEVCNNCKRNTGDLEPDHRIPRIRGGGEKISNFQLLCKECNNFKSVSCRGCNLECRSCAWAFPDEFLMVQLPRKLLEDLHEGSEVAGNEILSALRKRRDVSRKPK